MGGANFDSASCTLLAVGVFENLKAKRLKRFDGVALGGIADVERAILQRG